jgi:hypothetical protein
MEDNNSGLLALAVIFGLILLVCIICLFNLDVNLKQSTADEICKQITNDTTAIAKQGNECDYWGNCNLKCVLPSFDSTQEIVIVTNDK